MALFPLFLSIDSLDKEESSFSLRFGGNNVNTNNSLIVRLVNQRMVSWINGSISSKGTGV